jgi:putative membrane protein
MKKIIRFFLVSNMLATLTFAFASATSITGGNLNKEPDSTFVADAADAGMLEVQLGKLAASNGSSAEIKKFGENMVKDHSKANDELKALAQKKGINIPTNLSPKSRKTYQDLSKKKGADFDKAYAELMVKDHQEVITKFKQQSQSGNDQELKAWAQSKIGTLEHHLMMAQEMQKTSAKAGK